MKISDYTTLCALCMFFSSLRNLFELFKSSPTTVNVYEVNVCIPIHLPDIVTFMLMLSSQFWSSIQTQVCYLYKLILSSITWQKDLIFFQWLFCKSTERNGLYFHLYNTLLEGFIDLKNSLCNMRGTNLKIFKNLISK